MQVFIKRAINTGIKESFLCHRWDFHEFYFVLSPFTASSVTSLDVDWAGASSYAGSETQAMNDAFLLVYDRTNDNWVELDVEANIAVLEGGAVTDVPLSANIATALTDYIDS